MPEHELGTLLFFRLAPREAPDTLLGLSRHAREPRGKVEVAAHVLEPEEALV